MYMILSIILQILIENRQDVKKFQIISLFKSLKSLLESQIMRIIRISDNENY